MKESPTSRDIADIAVIFILKSLSRSAGFGISEIKTWPLLVPLGLLLIRAGQGHYYAFGARSAGDLQAYGKAGCHEAAGH